MTKTWDGVVKVKMLHRAGGTVILPEVLIVGSAGKQWVQPQFFYAPTLAFTDSGASATIHVAAVDSTARQPDGLECVVTFERRDRIAVLDDRSEVYRCSVASEYSPGALSLGRARLRTGGGIDLKVHHHTTPASLALITVPVMSAPRHGTTRARVSSRTWATPTSPTCRGCGRALICSESPCPRRDGSRSGSTRT